MIPELNASSFDETIRNGTVLVDFWAEWCGYCKVMDPIVEDVAAKLRDRLLVARLNADENIEVASRYNLGGLPAFIIFSQGKPVVLCSVRL